MMSILDGHYLRRPYDSEADDYHLMGLSSQGLLQTRFGLI